MAIKHYMVLDVGRPFLVFNDDGTLTFEPVTGEDLVKVKTNDPFGASCAWSSDVAFYFVILPDGIAMFDINGDGFFCRKRSAMFFDLFLKAPYGRRKAST